MPRTISAACRTILQNTTQLTNEDVVSLLVAEFPTLARPAAYRHVTGTRRSLAIEAGVIVPSPTRVTREVADLTADDLSDRAFGIEFEFTRGSRSIQRWADVLRPILGNQLYVASDYFHSDGRTWDLKTDSTCGFELATPRLTKRDWPLVEQVLAALKAAGARVSRRCGLHVHHETRDYTNDALVRLVRGWATFGQVISEILPASRRNNSYCTPLSRYLADATYENIHERAGERYRSLNVGHYWASGRVEVRQHHGTLDAKRTLAWVILTQRTVDAATRATTFNSNRSRAINARPMRRRFETLARWAQIPARVAAIYARRLPALVAAA